MKHKNAIVILAHGGPFDVAQAAMIMRGLKWLFRYDCGSFRAA